MVCLDGFLGLYRRVSETFFIYLRDFEVVPYVVSL